MDTTGKTQTNFVQTLPVPPMPEFELITTGYNDDEWADPDTSQDKETEEALKRFDDIWEKVTKFPEVHLTHYEWHMLLNTLEDNLRIVNRDNTQVKMMLERIASQLHSKPVTYQL